MGEHLDFVADELRGEDAEQEERAGLKDPDLPGEGAGSPRSCRVKYGGSEVVDPYVAPHFKSEITLSAMPASSRHTPHERARYHALTRGEIAKQEDPAPSGCVIPRG